MAATAPQPKQDLRIYGTHHASHAFSKSDKVSCVHGTRSCRSRICLIGADFKGASGTIRTSEVGPPDTPANSRAGTAGPADSAVRKAESDPAVPPPLTSKDAPQSPSNAGQQQQQARTPQNSRPQVSVVYKRLPQKSKDRLEEALIGWAAWHASAYGNDPDDSQDSLILNITSVRHPSSTSDTKSGCRRQPRCQIMPEVQFVPGRLQMISSDGCQPAAQVQQQPRCSGRLRFEPLVLSAAEGTSVDANVAAASAWMDIPEAGEEQQQLVGKGAFNLAYEKVSQNTHAWVRTQGNRVATMMCSWTGAALVVGTYICPSHTKSLACRAAACPNMIAACSRPWGKAQGARHSR